MTMVLSESTKKQRKRGADNRVAHVSKKPLPKMPEEGIVVGQKYKLAYAGQGSVGEAYSGTFKCISICEGIRKMYIFQRAFKFYSAEKPYKITLTEFELSKFNVKKV